MLSPCKDCPNKGCGSYHSQCDKYAEFKSFLAELQKHRLAEKDYSDYETSAFRRFHRGKRIEQR